MSVCSNMADICLSSDALVIKFTCFCRVLQLYRNRLRFLFHTLSLCVHYFGSNRPLLRNFIPAYCKLQHSCVLREFYPWSFALRKVQGMSVIGLEKFHIEKLHALYSQNIFQGIKSRWMWREGRKEMLTKFWLKTTKKIKHLKEVDVNEIYWNLS